MARPRPSMLIFIWFSSSKFAYRLLVNWLPCSLPAISGLLIFCASLKASLYGAFGRQVLFLQ
jgi:hypothetical protein